MYQPSDDFPELLDIFGRMIEQVRGAQIAPDDAWKNDGQVLLIKAFRHFESIQLLRCGVASTIGGKSFPHYVDHSSIAVLARSAYETFLLFHFIFCQGTAEQRRLRHRVWRMAGLRDRQRLQGPTCQTERGKRVLDEEKRQIDQLEKAIKEDQCFKALSKEVQTRVLKQNGDAKMGYRWADLAEFAGFQRKHGHDMYNLLSNYSHANSISVSQIRDAINKDEFEMLTRGVVTFCAIVMGRIIVSYEMLAPKAKEVLLEDPAAARLVNFWIGMTDQLSSHYASGTWSR